MRLICANRDRRFRALDEVEAGVAVSVLLTGSLSLLFVAVMAREIRRALCKVSRVSGRRPIVLTRSMHVNFKEVKPCLSAFPGDVGGKEAGRGWVSHAEG
jgi:hypothetical protein